jgi:hypothetical protein
MYEGEGRFQGLTEKARIKRKKEKAIRLPAARNPKASYNHSVYDEIIVKNSHK